MKTGPNSQVHWVGGLLSPQPSSPPAGCSLADAREDKTKNSGTQCQSKDSTKWPGQPGDAGDSRLVAVEVLDLGTEVKPVILVEE